MSPASSLAEDGAAGLLGAEPSATEAAVVGVEVEAVAAATTRSERLRSLGCICRIDLGQIFIIVNPFAIFPTCLCVFALAVDVVALRLRLRGGRARPRGGAAAAPVPLPAAAAARSRRRRLHVHRRRRGHRRRNAQSAFSRRINQTSQSEFPLLVSALFFANFWTRMWVT